MDEESRRKSRMPAFVMKAGVSLLVLVAFYYKYLRSTDISVLAILFVFLCLGIIVVLAVAGIHFVAQVGLRHVMGDIFRSMEDEYWELLRNQAETEEARLQKQQQSMAAFELQFNERRRKKRESVTNRKTIVAYSVV